MNSRTMGARIGSISMLQFIPFEDDWDAFERMRPGDLIPYRVGLLPEPAPEAPVAPATTPSQATHLPRQMSPRGFAGC
jgi:hypothetical protein